MSCGYAERLSHRRAGRWSLSVCNIFRARNFLNLHVGLAERGICLGSHVVDDVRLIAGSRALHGLTASLVLQRRDA